MTYESWHQQHRYAQNQEQLQLAAYLLQYAIRMAGSMGCNNLDHLTLISHLQANASLMSLRGYSAAHDQTLLPDSIKKRIIPESDVIEISYGTSENVFLQEAMATQSTPLRVANSKTFRINTVALVSDCQTAELFKITAVYQSKNITTLEHVPFSKLYMPPAQVHELVHVYYFVGTSSQKDSAGNPETGLYRYQDTVGLQELVEGITNLSFEYGSTTQPFQFVSADKVKDWNKVSVVKINLETAYEKNKTEGYMFYATIRNRSL